MLFTEEEVEIEIKLRSTWHNNPPKCKVYLNEIVLLQNTEVREPLTISWKGNLPIGDHKIKIWRHSKDFRTEVILDEHNKIIKDQLLEIESVKIDGIDLRSLLHRCSKFYEDTDEKLVYESMLNLGENGTWELEFSVPTYVWLLQSL